MNRRTSGLLLVLLTLICAVVVPDLLGRNVNGTAVAVRIPGPPAVGACVVTTPSKSFQTSSDGYLVLPALTFGSCQGPHFGEVTAVLQNVGRQRGTPSVTPDAQGGQVWTTCPDAENGYVGLTGYLDGTAGGGWYPVLNSTSIFGGPDRRQQAVGQDWAACVLVMRSIGSNDAISYAGSARNSVTGGRLPDNFGVCSQDPTVFGDQVVCTSPHRFQLLARFDLTRDRATQTQRLVTCHTLATGLTRMPDLTAGGRLTLSITTDRFDQNGRASTDRGPLHPGESGTSTCALGTVGDARLSGSLLGLGSQPIPIVG